MDTADIIRMERHRAPVEQDTGDSLADNQAYLNRYNLAIHRLDSAPPREVAAQVQLGIGSAKRGFEVYLADAVKRRDEKLIGKLILRALDEYRHREADREADQ